MLKLLLIFLLAGCTTIDVSRLPPDDFPKLTTTVHYVDRPEMSRNCEKYRPAFSVQIACMEWDFIALTCKIWIVIGTQEWVVDHERLHCLGYDHIGESILRDAWEAYKRTLK